MGMFGDEAFARNCILGNNWGARGPEAEKMLSAFVFLVRIKVQASGE
jgi:hypothetical protein